MKALACWGFEKCGQCRHFWHSYTTRVFGNLYIGIYLTAIAQDFVLCDCCFRILFAKGLHHISLNNAIPELSHDLKHAE